MELNDLIPEKPEFTLASKNKTYTLRFPNLEDRVVLKRKFTDKGVQDALQGQDWEKLSYIVMLLLDSHDRADFASFDEDVVGADGEKTIRRISGPENFLRAISGLQEQAGLYRAIGSAFAGADPKVRKLIEEEVKKNMMAAESAGPKSSTESQTHTDTPSTK